MYSNAREGIKIRKWLKGSASALAYRTGLPRLGYGLWRRSLTVVNYHRIEDVKRPGVDSFKPNISAHPEDFDRQVGYLKRWFHVIRASQLVDWLDGSGELPDHAALITFDDGYLDNYVHAFPILRQHNLPALIFLTAGHIESDEGFDWDLAAYCFQHTSQASVRFPDGSERGWESDAQRDEVCRQWMESLKALPEPQKKDIARGLPGQMGVSVPPGHFRKLMMNWEQVREMRAGGIEFGGHTLNHPILTRIPLEQAREEIAGSKKRIEQELGEPVLTFAYPNGMADDLNGQVEGAVKQAGYRAAFTLMNGPASLKEVKEKPFAIRRIFISHKHGMPEFAAMLSPLNRLRG
jgi:peptidoglycan/xylan/chitin deacetylase (PgdA/CDA1 family)